MAHTRIRKFNTRDTYPEQRLDNDLCQAVIAGNTVFLRGQIGQDQLGKGCGSGQRSVQTLEIMERHLTEQGPQVQRVAVGQPAQTLRGAPG